METLYRVSTLINFYGIIYLQGKEKGLKMEYMIEFDGVNEYSTEWWSYDDYDEMVAEICNELRDMGGGHADIYENGVFVGDVEV